MKRFALVALLATLIFGVVSSASATELKVKGSFDVYGMWSANLRDFDSDVADGDNYVTTQRMRTYFTYVANENLKAVLGLEMDVIWGQNDSGDWGTDGNTDDPIEVKHAYLDFNFPDSKVNVKAGLQYVALPGIFGNPVFDDDAAALVVSAPITDMVTVAVGYTRGVDDDDNFDTAAGADRDDIDMTFIAVPVALDGFSIAPYFAYAWLGANALGTAEDVTAWVMGANAELTMFDPLTIAADLIYGEADCDDDTLETQGWYGALAASYKFDMVTPTLFALYFSGNDEYASDGGESLPQLAEGWGISPYVGGVRAFSTTYDTFSGLNNSLWAVGLVLDGISFVEIGRASCRERV